MIRESRPRLCAHVYPIKPLLTSPQVTPNLISYLLLPHCGREVVAERLFRGTSRLQLVENILDIISCWEAGITDISTILLTPLRRPPVTPPISWSRLANVQLLLWSLDSTAISQRFLSLFFSLHIKALTIQCWRSNSPSIWHYLTW